mmetsp:Transcript_11072/g.20425  ORF Transcript_11072/g.20425 Transcript_11072/m.20425 type:complete len:96 (-) Transcript_11072:134-421(-)
MTTTNDNIIYGLDHSSASCCPTHVEPHGATTAPNATTCSKSPIIVQVLFNHHMDLDLPLRIHLHRLKSNHSIYITTKRPHTMKTDYLKPKMLSQR